MFETLQHFSIYADDFITCSIKKIYIKTIFKPKTMPTCLLLRVAIRPLGRREKLF